MSVLSFSPSSLPIHAYLPISYQNQDPRFNIRRVRPTGNPFERLGAHLQETPKLTIEVKPIYMAEDDVGTRNE
jgi:hypothetical protein